MAILIPLRHSIGCTDCQTHWELYCPLCKSKEGSLKTLDFKPVNLLEHRYIKKDGNVFHYMKKQQIITIKKEKKPIVKKTKGVKEKTWRERVDEWWNDIHPKRVITLIAKGHDPACKCCLTIFDLTFDHVIPIIEGGKNTYKNGQILCHYCNNLKGRRIISITELRKEVDYKNIRVRVTYQDGSKEKIFIDRALNSVEIIGYITNKNMKPIVFFEVLKGGRWKKEY